jgi:hypothetical protein
MRRLWMRWLEDLPTQQDASFKTSFNKKQAPTTLVITTALGQCIFTPAGNQRQTAQTPNTYPPPSARKEIPANNTHLQSAGYGRYCSKIIQTEVHLLIDPRSPLHDKDLILSYFCIHRKPLVDMFADMTAMDRNRNGIIEFLDKVGDIADCPTGRPNYTLERDIAICSAGPAGRLIKSVWDHCFKAEYVVVVLRILQALFNNELAIKNLVHGEDKVEEVAF